jgi:hypothetical protein
MSYWRVAAWVALCLPASRWRRPRPPGRFREGARPRPRIQASLMPRTHLFGQRVVETVEVPAGSSVKARFPPYRIVGRATVYKRATVQYRYTLQCLEPACTGAPGAEQELASRPPA